MGPTNTTRATRSSAANDNLIFHNIGPSLFFKSTSSSNANQKKKSSSKKTKTSPTTSLSLLLEGISYSELREAVITKYHASDPETTDLEEEFDEALEAMKAIEFDGVSVPINGVDGLYIGSLGAAYNWDGLRAAGITHILSLETAAPCTRYDSTEYTCLQIDHLWDEDPIRGTFDKTLPFIDQAIKTEGGHILVHDWSGRSRSVATIVAYMIKYRQMTPKDALSKIRETRHHAHPNHEYIEELDEFYEQIQDQLEKQDYTFIP